MLKIFQNFLRFIYNMFGNLHHHLHKAKQHFKTVTDFGQRAWDTIGHVVKKSTHAINGVNAEASNWTGMHPMIDDGIGFLNRITSGANQVFDWYTKTDEKKNSIEQKFKDTKAGGNNNVTTLARRSSAM